MSKVTGRAYFDFPGIGRVSSKQGASVDRAGFNRPEAMSDLGVEGYTEEPIAGTFTCQIQHRAGLDVDYLDSLTDVNIAFVTDTGTTWVLREAWTTKPCRMSGGVIDLEMKFVNQDTVQA